MKKIIVAILFMALIMWVGYLASRVYIERYNIRIKCVKMIINSPQMSVISEEANKAYGLCLTMHGMKAEKLYLK